MKKKPCFKIQLKKRIIIVIFNTQYDMNSTMIRFAEEFLDFSKKNYTLDDFMDVYVKKHKEMTYFQDWEGITIEAREIKKIKKKKYRLRKKEKDLLVALPNYLDKYRQIICLYKSSFKNCIKHEIAHIYYDFFKTYRKEMNKFIKEYPKYVSLRNELEKNYDKDNKLILNEMQAHLATGIATNYPGFRIYKPCKELFKKYWFEYGTDPCPDDDFMI